MKKYFAFATGLACFLFTGCFLLDLDTTLSTQIVDKNITVEKNGEVYLLKLNSSDTQLIKAANTGYIVSKTDRSAGALENPEIPDVAQLKDINGQVQTNNLNQSFISSLENIPVERSISPSGAVVSGKDNTLGSRSKFWSYTRKEPNSGFLEGINEQIDVTLKKTGSHCYVYVDKNVNVSTTLINNIQSKFDSIFDLETGIIGNPLYSSYNSTYFGPSGDKVCILISDLYGDAQNGDVLGYFYSADLFNQDFLDNHVASLGIINSNQCEVFYIDAYYLINSTEEIYSTLVHEFNHMINFVQKTLNYMTAHPNTNPNYMPSCSTWFTEMLAMTTEDMFASYLGYTTFEHTPKERLLYYNLFHNYGFRNWENQYKIKGYEQYDNLWVYVNYANTYAFGAYLARNFGGTDLIKQIAQNEYVDEEAITKAIKSVYCTGNNANYDFDFALMKFGTCLINTDEPDSSIADIRGENQYFSFNRQERKTNTSELYFMPIDLTQCYQINSNGQKQYIGPTVYKNYSQQADLGPNGFSLHYVGKNLSSFDIKMVVNSPIDYYKVIK